jgi:hypothetical protein
VPSGEHAQLVTEHQQLDVPGEVIWARPEPCAQQAANHEVDQQEQHRVTPQRGGQGRAMLPNGAAQGRIGVCEPLRVRVVHPGVPLPVAALPLEATALLAVTVALAAAGSRLAPQRRGGAMAAPTLFAVTGAAILLPARVALYAVPGGPGWAGAHQRWAMLLGCALVAFAVASRDPAHGHVRSHVRNHTRRLAPSPLSGAHRPNVQHPERSTTRSAP